MINVLFAGGGTGGHLYPALALAAALKQERPDVQVHFVGALRGVEARVLPAEKQPHTLLPFEPLRRSRIWENWKLIPSVIRSFLGLRKLFNELKPRLVVGTGGYASAPACMYAVTRGVPVAIQEQNSHAGLSQKLLSRWAKQVHVGFPEARAQLEAGAKHGEILALGNPIRPPQPNIDKAAARAKFGLRADSTVVLVTGGSQGSKAINDALLKALASSDAGKLVGSFEILWATGPSHIEAIQNALPADTNSFVHPVGYINNMPEAMAVADVAVTRAGAMATAELLAWGIPMLLIPLPTAAADHQTHNARAIANAGAGVLLLEKDMTPERLWQELTALVSDDARRAQMRTAALERARPNAARDIAQHLAQLLGA